MGTPIFTGDVFQWARFCNGALCTEGKFKVVFTIIVRDAHITVVYKREQ